MNRKTVEQAGQTVSRLETRAAFRHFSFVSVCVSVCLSKCVCPSVSVPGCLLDSQIPFGLGDLSLKLAEMHFSRRKHDGGGAGRTDPPLACRLPRSTLCTSASLLIANHVFTLSSAQVHVPESIYFSICLDRFDRFDRSLSIGQPLRRLVELTRSTNCLNVRAESQIIFAIRNTNRIIDLVLFALRLLEPSNVSFRSFPAHLISVLTFRPTYRSLRSTPSGH